MLDVGSVLFCFVFFAERCRAFFSSQFGMFQVRMLCAVPLQITTIPPPLTVYSFIKNDNCANTFPVPFSASLQAQRKEVFLQERYSHYSLTDPFLALQRDFECGVPRGDKERRPLGTSPISVLEAVMAHCRKMQERMSAQLAAAESRQKRVRDEERPWSVLRVLSGTYTCYLCVADVSSK